jgi:CRP/FNR family transcriptional regulator
MKNIFDEYRIAGISATLRNCRLFSGLNQKDLENIASITVVKTYKKGDYVFKEGDPCHGFFIVQKGAINVHRVNLSGREQVIHVFRAGDSFAEAALAMESGYPADARAEEDSQLLLIQKDGFLSLLKTQPEFALRLFVAMSVHLRVLVEQLEAVSLESVDSRLAKWLLKRMRCLPEGRKLSFELEIPKRVLAAELGTVSETLSRTLSKFKSMGLINVSGKKIDILNPSGLQEIAEKSKDVY